jgi:pyridine nucleotide-disulfide oxidoreductase family protein
MNRRVILAGGGHAHLAVLADWAKRPLPGAERWLVTSARHTAYSGMLPGWLTGIYRASDLMIDLKPLAEKAGTTLILADVKGLDADNRTLSLSSGETMEFDLLSLATGGEADISSLATRGIRLLPVRPIDAFMERWSNFLEANVLAPALHVAVVGGGAAGVELALAVGTSLRGLFRGARVSLVTPEDGFLSGHASEVKRSAMAELSRLKIALHFAEAAGEVNGLLLSNGSFLPVDCAIAATGSRAPRWLARSRLACDERGFIAVGPDMRSISHEAVFAAGDIIDRVDREMPRSGVHAVKAGPILAANLRASLDGSSLRHYLPRQRTLYLLSTGDRRAIMSWGEFAWTGRLAWRLKDWIDRRFVESYRVTVQGAAQQ